MSRKISLPASAQEWAASASIDAEPVMNAATDLATAINRLAPKRDHHREHVLKPYPDPTRAQRLLPGSPARFDPQATARPCNSTMGPDWSLPTIVRGVTTLAAGKKTVVAVASGVFDAILAAGIGVAGLASADPTTTPTTSPSGAPSAGVDQPGPGHGGPGRGAHDRLDGDLAAKLAEKLGVTEDKVTTALKEIRDANKPDPTAKPDPSARPDPGSKPDDTARGCRAGQGLGRQTLASTRPRSKPHWTRSAPSARLERATALKDKTGGRGEGRNADSGRGRRRPEGVRQEV